MNTRLKTTQVAGARVQLLVKQGYRCALCSLPCLEHEAVLDHDHGTGAIRATLHRSCNALLGKVENNAPRYGVRNLSAFLHGTAAYLQLHTDNRTGLIHPSHKTEEEKRLRRNLLAKKRRAIKKQE